MWLNENLIKFIESCAEITKATIYISDLKKIKFYTIPNKGSKKIEKIISRELLETLLIISTGIDQDRYVITNNKSNIIPLLDDKNIELNIQSEIIFPIWADNELKGTLIVTSANRELDEYDLELTRCMQLFIEESVVNSINEDFENKKTNKKVKTKLITTPATSASDKDNSNIMTKENIDENDM